jgi:putative transposase
MVAKSWFSIELNSAPSGSFPRICSPSSTSFPAECTDSGDTLRKSKKIRIYPTALQKQTLRRWFGIARRAYNATVELLRRPGSRANWKKIKTGIIVALPSWAAEAPYQVRSVAVRDACRAVSAAKRKFKAGQGLQRVSFRTRKNPIQSCFIPKDALTCGGIYPTMTGGSVLWSEKLPKEHGDSRLVCHGGRWYVSVPYAAQRAPSETQGRVVALDPGIRSFQSFFAEDGCGKIGRGDFGRIQRLCQHADDLIGKMVKEPMRLRRKHMQEAVWRLRHQITDLVDELHHKAALFLVTNYDVILLPTFETQNMVRRGARKLRRKSVRAMLTFAHYRFKQFLKHKAFEHGKVVVDVNEAWTSKTVSWTGEINEKLGGAKTVTSKLDGQKMDRDYNGARGIFLRALGDQPALLRQSASAPESPQGDFGSEK